MISIKIEDMTDIEVIETRLSTIDLAIDTIFKTTEGIFKASDKGKATTELKLLTNIGANCAAIKIYCNKLKGQIELLKELHEEK